MGPLCHGCRERGIHVGPTEKSIAKPVEYTSEARHSIDDSTWKRFLIDQRLVAEGMKTIERERCRELACH